MKKLWHKLICWIVGIHAWEMTDNGIECKCGAEMTLTSLLDKMSAEERKELAELAANVDEVSGGGEEYK